MMRPIDADALNIDFYDEYETEDDAYAYGYISKHQIDSAPTIDAVSVVRGEWIKEGCAKGSEMCNQCGFVQFEGRVNNFCPNCGAKMDKEGE